MYLYGASGHAKVIIEILEAEGVAIDGLFDDNESVEVLCGYNVSRYDGECRGEKIVSIGSNGVRKKIVERIGGDFGVAVHPSAIISPRATVGEGTVVMHGAIVQSDVRVGKHVIVNTGATIDHECIVEDYAHISPNATLCGNVVVGEGTQIGAGSVVVPGVRIGKWSLICAGSVVTKDIPDNCIASGNRCKVIKYIDNK
ncbi:MAG: acetyltransferase [Alistipes sp.]|jgi:sugar O-acyltransferase (sialic acid O-acetyltransferase NeuD family)|nr:acetyltransferase [Alistipes sp.]